MTCLIGSQTSRTLLRSTWLQRNRGEACSDREGLTTASITIPHLDDEVKTRFRVRATANGRSMDEQTRIVLREAVGREAEPENLASFIRERFEQLSGMGLELQR